MPKPCQRAEKTVEHESNSDTSCSWCRETSIKRLKISRRIETIQTTTQLKSARILPINNGVECSLVVVLLLLLLLIISLLSYKKRQQKT